MRIRTGTTENSISLGTLRRISEGFSKVRYYLSRNPISVVGLIVIFVVVVAAILAPFLAPYPKDAGLSFDLSKRFQPPSWKHLCGTDHMGRDILSRVIFGYRFSLMLPVVILSIVVPVGSILGLIAGYFKGTWIDTVIMRVTDIFVSLPALVLALAVSALLTPTVFHAMLAISVAWWPRYCRLVYSVASSIRNEDFVQAAELLGGGSFHILFRELLPNCISPVLTRVTLDAGFVILTGACLSFLGLGIQPPKPGLGTMVAKGLHWIPGEWWLSGFPALAILVVVLGFNLFGDGLRDILEIEHR